MVGFLIIKKIQKSFDGASSLYYIVKWLRLIAQIDLNICQDISDILILVISHIVVLSITSD